MYYTTGFPRDEIMDLCAMINNIPVEDRKSWPPILGLFKSAVIALTYMRHNRVQCELGETYDVSQPTISRAITVLTPLLKKVSQKYVPTAEELDTLSLYVVDGALLPCWSWASHPLPPGAVLRQAQDHRHERPGRVHARWRPRLDLRPDRRQPTRHVLPG